MFGKAASTTVWISSCIGRRPPAPVVEPVHLGPPGVLAQRLWCCATTSRTSDAVGRGPLAFDLHRHWFTIGRDLVRDERDKALAAAAEARHNEQTAIENEHRAKHALFDSYLGQARSGSVERSARQRIVGLLALGKAAELLPELELGGDEALQLRNQAIACLAPCRFASSRAPYCGGVTCPFPLTVGGMLLVTSRGISTFADLLTARPCCVCLGLASNRCGKFSAPRATSWRLSIRPTTQVSGSSLPVGFRPSRSTPQMVL